MNKVITIIVCICVVFSLSGCLAGNIEQETKKSQDKSKAVAGKMVQLTERQKDILQENGLPTNPEELDRAQLSAIIAMEELFEYLDQKYEEEFEYAGYIAESPLDTEQLMVQVVGGTSLDIVSVYRENGVITDDYANLLVKEPYEAAINEFFEQYEGGIESKTFSKIYGVEGDMNTQNLIEIVRAGSNVYIRKSESNMEILSQLGMKVGEWYARQAKGRVSYIHIIILEHQEYEEINKFNAFNDNKNQKEVAHVQVYIDHESKIEVTQRGK